ncbi:MAG TPA: TlpA disulfide reductase family protein [Candidatus Polarisedimenticolia bacterium]|nr:TlpA disulfide reductase family protein [Candidatus Polarisedimenticolia bacterium]
MKRALFRAILPAAAILSIAAAPAVPTIDRQGYAELIERLRGKAVVVNMWATWCEPCREEFPELVRFHEAVKGRGGTVVAVSLDPPSAADLDIKPFLASQSATFPAYVKRPGDDDAFINTIDPAWSGALPATFIYDREGRRIRSFFGPVTEARLRKEVEPLLPKGD